MVHVGESGRIHGSGASLVDFNRGGTPLVEIVTEPDLRDAGRGARVGAAAARRRSASSASPTSTWRRGACACDANVSVRPRWRDELGTKTELKNMNSFRFLERGIAAELERQGALASAIRCAGSKWSVSCATVARPPRSARLALDLGLDPALEEAEAVHVLELGLGAELVARRPAHRDVGVAAQARPPPCSRRRRRSA